MKTLFDIAIITSATALLGCFCYWCYKDIQEERPTRKSGCVTYDSSTGRFYDAFTNEEVARPDWWEEAVYVP